MLTAPSRALVITPHPDDAEISCGGTVANWINSGTQVFYVLCTDGSKGTDDPDLEPGSLSATRKLEQIEAAETLGVKKVVMLDYPDGELEDSREFRGRLVREIRRFRPDIVLCPDPHRRTFYFHRDHRIAGIVAQDAVFPYARDRLHFNEHELEGLKPHKTGMILFWGTEEPDVFIDISEFMDRKLDSLGCHKSQLSGLDGAFERLRASGEQAGKHLGLKYAEAFRKVVFRT